jgi:hypothetical protein
MSFIWSKYIAVRENLSEERWRLGARVFVAGVWIEIGKGTNEPCPAKRKRPG